MSGHIVLTVGAIFELFQGLDTESSNNACCRQQLGCDLRNTMVCITRQADTEDGFD